MAASSDWCGQECSGDPELESDSAAECSVRCNFNVANLDPTDPNHCYDAAVSPSTYWREELFRIDHAMTETQLSFRYVHDAWDTTVLTPQWGDRAQHVSDRRRTASLGRARAWWPG